MCVACRRGSGRMSLTTELTHHGTRSSCASSCRVSGRPVNFHATTPEPGGRRVGDTGSNPHLRCNRASGNGAWIREACGSSRKNTGRQKFTHYGRPSRCNKESSLDLVTMAGTNTSTAPNMAQRSSLFLSVHPSGCSVSSCVSHPVVHAPMELSQVAVEAMHISIAYRSRRSHYACSQPEPQL